MKTNILTLLLLTLTLFFIRCSTGSEQVSPTTKSETAAIGLSGAKSWFYSHPEFLVQPGKKARHHRFTTPEWEKAAIRIGANKVKYLEVPLASTQKVTSTLRFKDQNGQLTGSVNLPAPSLVFYWNSVKGMQVLVLQRIPNPSVQPSTTGKFSGRTFLYDWQGMLQYGSVFENGKKTRSISRSGGDHSNSRWDQECELYATCNFHCVCQFGTAPVGYAYVEETVQAVGTDYCDAPTSYPGPPYYNCSPWDAGLVDSWMECAWTWYDDEDPDPDVLPDPDPDPDPTIDYGIQDITNQLTDPCLRSTANMLTNFGMPSQIIGKMNQYFNASARLNLTYKDKSAFFVDFPGGTFPDNIMARHKVITTTGGVSTTVIYVNDPELISASVEYITATLLHEIAHAVLTIEFGQNMNFDHNQMATNYLADMNAVLENMFSINNFDATSLNIDGLQNTILGSALQQMHPQLWNSYVDRAAQYRTGAAGAQCP